MKKPVAYYSYFLPVLMVLQMFHSCKYDDSSRTRSADILFIDGITMVAPPQPYVENPATEINALGADWVAIVPYGFTPDDKPAVRFNQSRQWWGETKEGIIETIRHCRESGMKIMLKPQIWAHRKWSGDISYTSVAQWEAWEKEYEHYILSMAEIADSLSVELFCIGTELKSSVIERPDYWSGLIQHVRRIYHGSITYAANWDSYKLFPFWADLDFIGINAYFPLSESRQPDHIELIRAWKPISLNIEELSQKTGKSVIFTEFGYLSTDFNAHNTWEKEDQIHELSANEEAQSRTLEALFEWFYPRDWWAGGFLWKWYPPNYRIRNKAKDYTVQDKKAQEVLKKWYKN